MRRISVGIDARFVNDVVQEKVRAGDWADAQRWLRRGFEGISTDDVYRVLSGETAFVNVDGDGKPSGPSLDMRFASDVGAPLPDGQAEYVAYLRKRWAGAIRVENAYYQPYAFVTNLGQYDIERPARGLSNAARRYLKGGWGLGEAERKPTKAHMVRDGFANRPAHYVDDPDQDLVVDCRVPAPIASLDAGRLLPVLPFLFRRLPDLPPWFEPVRTFGASLDAALAAGRVLEERGHRQLYGLPWVDSRIEAAKEEALRTRSRQGAHAAEVEAERAERARRVECEAARKAVMAQAALPDRGGWLDLRVGGDVLRVPRAPFEHWALDRCGAGHLAPPWDPCSRSGMKLQGDDPMHTDWMLGAGLDPLTLRWYGPDPEAASLSDAADALLGEVQRRVLSHGGLAVLADGGFRAGRAYVARRGRGDMPEPGDVVVLPDASADWLDVVVTACGGGAGAVVVARGGAMAHLVVVTAARGATILRDPEAMRRYADGQSLSVDPAGGAVSISPLEPVAEFEAPFLGGP